MRTRYYWLFWSIFIPLFPIIFLILVNVIQGNWGSVTAFLNTSAIPLYVFGLALQSKGFLEEKLELNAETWDRLERLDLLPDRPEYKYLRLISACQDFWLPLLSGIGLMLGILLLFQEANLAIINISSAAIAIINAIIMLLVTLLGIVLSIEAKEIPALLKKLLGDTNEHTRPDIHTVDVPRRLRDGNNITEDTIESNGHNKSSKESSRKRDKT